MKINIYEDRSIQIRKVAGTQNENDATILEMNVPEQYEDFNKKIVFVVGDTVVWDIIEDNKYLINKSISKNREVDFYIWLTKDEEDFRSETKTLHFNPNKDASQEITPEEVNGVNTVVNILEEEITKVTGLEARLIALIENVQNKLDNGEFVGEKGDTGNGIKSIELIRTEGLQDYYLITFDNDETQKYIVTNGYTPQKGIDYFDGEDGRTPQRGTDYWTENDKQEVINDVLESTEVQNALETSENALDKANTAETIAKQANFAKGYQNYETLINELNTDNGQTYRVGQSFLIITLNVPDLWISSIEETSVNYIYVDDNTLIEELKTNGIVQVGYYKLSMLETLKQDLTNFIKDDETDDVVIKGITENEKELTNLQKTSAQEWLGFRVMTQAEYDALETKETGIFYFTEEEE